MVDQAEIHRMANSAYWTERKEAANILSNNFVVLYDKKLAWEDLHKLTQDKDWIVRERAANALSIVFPKSPDTEQAWEDLHKLVQDKNASVRWRAVDALGTVFQNIPNKEQAWGDLHLLIYDSDESVRMKAVNALGSIFSYIPNKEQAWEDLHNLTKDRNTSVRVKVLNVLCSIFLDIPDKKQAFEDIHKLTHDWDISVRSWAAITLSTIFPYNPDKEQAWEDLHQLTRDSDTRVRWRAADALGTAFPYIPDKRRVWIDMIRLTRERESHIRASANRSLGRASIFRATNAENETEFKNELENALNFFEKSSKEAIDFKPARFCFSFYRSFYTITFKKHEAEVEVQKYLSEARRAMKGSKSKEKLLEAVENLANALREAQKVQGQNLNYMKCDLGAYKRYCDRAADLLADTEERAPGATNLIRKGLPIIDQRIKDIISEIQEKSSALCKQTLDTPFEDLGKEVNRAGQTFPQIRDPIGLEKGFINLWAALSSICAKMPEEERGEACELLKKAGDELYIEDKLPLINMVLSKISSQISAAKNIETVEKKLDEIMVSLKPGIREELVISVGVEFGGTGAQHVITIPLQEISYPDLKKDLEKVKGKGILKFASLPAKLAGKVKDYLIRNKKDELLNHLS